jgi:hypothetical protein
MTPCVTNPQNPRYQDGALSSDGVWITYNSENVVWLTLRVSAVMFGRVGEDDRHRRWIWQGMDMQLCRRLLRFLGAFM